MAVIFADRFVVDFASVNEPEVCSGIFGRKLP
jgi:hypothetical protein